MNQIPRRSKSVAASEATGEQKGETASAPKSASAQEPKSGPKGKSGGETPRPRSQAGFLSGLQIGAVLGLSSMMGYGVISYYQLTRQAGVKLQAEIEQLKLTPEEEALKQLLAVDRLGMDFFLTLVRPSQAAWMGHRVRLVQEPQNNFRGLLSIIARLPASGAAQNPLFAKARGFAWLDLGYLAQNLPGQRAELKNILGNELRAELGRTREGRSLASIGSDSLNAVVGLHGMMMQVASSGEEAAKVTAEAMDQAKGVALKDALKESYLARSGVETAQANTLLESATRTVNDRGAAF